MAAKVAALLASEDLDYRHVKEVFRHTRALLAVEAAPPPKAPRQLLSPEEAFRAYEAVASAKKRRHRTMLRLQMLTGMHTSELVGILLEWVDLARLEIRFPSTGRKLARTVFVPEILREDFALEHAKASFIGQDHLFLSHHRRPYGERYIRRLFRASGVRAGLDGLVTAESMRLQLLSYFVREGVLGKDLLEAARAHQPHAGRVIERLAEAEMRAVADRAAGRLTDRPALTIVPHPK